MVKIILGPTMEKNVDGAALLVALFSRGFVQLRDTVVALD